MRGALTLFESPDLLAKRWRLDADGQAVKESAAQMTRGTYRVVEFGNAEALAAILDSVTTHQAVSASLPHDGSAAGRITTKKRAEPGAKTRSKSDFGLQSRPGLVIFDSDEGGMSRDDLWALFLAVMPALGSAAVIWRASGSSNIWNGDQEVTGLRGQHLYFPIANASDGPRVIKTLAARLWLAGHGTVAVSRAGSLLVRCPVDTAPSDAARLIFAGGAECLLPLEQRREPPLVLNRGGFLDPRSVLDLTADERGRYEALIEQARAAAMPEAMRKRAEHRAAVVAARLPDLMKQQVTAAEAEARIGAAVDAAYGGLLLGDFELTAVHDDGRREAVTVAQVLADRDHWHGADILDPLNPEHRGGAADARLYLHGTSPIAYSLDDGGKVYRLRVARQRAVVSKGCRAELVAAVATAVAADPRVFASDIGPVVVEDCGRQRAVNVDRLMNLSGQSVALVTKTASGAEAPADLPREAAALILATLGA